MAIAKFYSSTFPPSPLRVNHMLKLKGIELDFVEIDMMKAEQMSDEYKSVNPEGTIPALLLDDGTLLTEVIGILHYLEETYPEVPLMGTSAVEKAQVSGWIHKIMMQGLMSVAEVLRNGAAPGFENRALPGPLDFEQIPALIERGTKKLAHFFIATNAHLEGRDWLVGDSVTQADIDLFVSCSFAAIIRQKVDSESMPNLAAHQARMSALLS